MSYPKGAYNHKAKMGYESSPLNIGEDYNPDGPNWFVTLFFNGACFVRRDGKTRLRDDWREHANDVSKSVDAWVERNYCPQNSPPRPKTFEEWSEDMISNFGDEITPELPNIWQDIYKMPAAAPPER